MVAPGTGHRASRHLRIESRPFLPFFSCPFPLTFFFFSWFPVFLPPSLPLFPLFCFQLRPRDATWHRPQRQLFRANLLDTQSSWWPPAVWGRPGSGPWGCCGDECVCLHLGGGRPAVYLCANSPGCTLALGCFGHFTVCMSLPQRRRKKSCEAPRGRPLPVAGCRVAVRGTVQPELRLSEIRRENDILRLLREDGSAQGAVACERKRIGPVRNLGCAS